MKRPTPIKRIISRTDSPLVKVVGETLLRSLVASPDVRAWHTWDAVLISLAEAATDRGMLIEAQCLLTMCRITQLLIKRELGAEMDGDAVVASCIELAERMGGPVMAAYEKAAWNAEGERPCWVLRKKEETKGETK